MSRDEPVRDRPRLLLVSGIITPYTHALYDEVARRHDLDIHVVTCAEAEPNRGWRLPDAVSYRRTTLGGLRWHRAYVKHIYLNPGVIGHILRGRPDVVMICDFSPTMLLATATARLAGIPVVLGSDTQLAVDPGGSSLPHRLARRLIAPQVSAAIGASSATVDFFAHYGIRRDRTVVSPVVPAWDYDGQVPSREQRPYDLLFCGLLDDRFKGALHFLDTVKALRARGRTLRVRVAGDGPLRQHIEDELAQLGVEARFDGYVQQDEIAEVYLSAKLLMFPSRGDSWGLVANEAAQCGTPVLISPHAQAAFDLVERFGCGRVMPLDVPAWAGAVERLLDDGDEWGRKSRAGVASRRHFSLAAAADGFVRGIRIALGDDDAPAQAGTRRDAATWTGS